MMLKVAVLLFNYVEVLDFAGPFEVFSVTGKKEGKDLFDVYTVAETKTISARGGLSINVHHTFTTCPLPDILIVPGGGGFRSDGTPYGTRLELHNDILLDFIVKCAQTCTKLLSVCTGSTLLAKRGLLDGKVSTTHHLSLNVLQELAPTSRVCADARVADNGRVVCSGGISAGIDMCFYVITQLHGAEETERTAKYMEYNWQPDQLKVVKF
ncbi:hypothetical protein SARC_02021 [Sphaeroforma arctica JP610]|uniref:DJ-1/PfpI domain-containing protein n=1 Tax=Sphaeroforma arctica JP610 TaxID=667725 RepID=A0A0L0GA90_9EUKA|nr:hypothetical protein SARC_02021 [Sphaeroforma arctica JP610]KNC85796.1 hypothetical protein SARC_02021 [Sphaeroforma arctica JP610]|eukprot:XP_014159698.1 hypothetical protein SARC_02021 [Sphaeroforma arctica JP610]